MRDVSDSFSDTYVEAREKFIAAARSAGASLKSFRQTERGPNGEDLCIDFALLGPDDAENAIVIVSGTHGCEAFCGAGIQVELLSNPTELAKFADTKLIFLHGHNPYAWAWLRRTNENNVDINRNYVDFSQKHTVNEPYREVQDLLLPDEFDDSAIAAIGKWVDENGSTRLNTVVLSGQRVSPTGMFYGGIKHEWATETVTRELPLLTKNHKRVAFVDVHTGMGGDADGLILHIYPPGSKHARLYDEWYEGKVSADMEGVDASEIEYENSGSIVAALEHLLPDQETYGLVLEYGVVELERVINALIADNWLNDKGDPESEQGRRIKQENLDTLYGNNPAWKACVWAHSSWLLEKTAEGLRILTD